MPDDEDEDKNATRLDFGFPSDLSGVASSDIGGISTLEESSSIVPGMSSLATFDNDDFYSQADLAHQVCIMQFCTILGAIKFQFSIAEPPE